MQIHPHWSLTFVLYVHAVVIVCRSPTVSIALCNVYRAHVTAAVFRFTAWSLPGIIIVYRVHVAARLCVVYRVRIAMYTVPGPHGAVCIAPCPHGCVYCTVSAWGCVYCTVSARLCADSPHAAMENVSEDCLMEGAKFSCRFPNVMNHFLYPQHASVILFYGNQEKGFVVVFDVAVTVVVVVVVVVTAGLLFSTFIIRLHLSVSQLRAKVCSLCYKLKLVVSQVKCFWDCRMQPNPNCHQGGQATRSVL